MTTEARDDWYRRPTWRPGRSFYAWHITFADDPVLQELHAKYQPLLGAAAGLTPVPAQWLHLPMQGIGFTDKVSQEDLDPVVDAARQRLEFCLPLEIQVAPAVVNVACVQVPVAPVNKVRRLRNQLRAAITDVWGRDAVPALPELEPHIALGYWTGPARPLGQRLPAPVKTEITHATLINLNRDEDSYEWTTYATVRLGLPPTDGEAAR